MDNEVEAVLAASRVLMGVVAESMAPVAESISLSQYRVLVIVATHGPLNLNFVAGALGVHPSNATRACDRLVEAGLLARTESAIDRRRVDLALTAAGMELIARVMDHRRAAIDRVLARMDPGARHELAAVFEDFAAAADEFSSFDGWESDLWGTGPAALLRQRVGSSSVAVG
jgi:DNA-binding MarR family transcriptional regulator